MQINELYEQIFASDLPQSVKTVMLDIVNELQRAVHEYKVRGAKGLKKSLAKVFGGLAANADELQKSAGTDELAALAKLVVTVEKAYTTVSNAKMIYGAVTTILPMLGSGS